MAEFLEADPETIKRPRAGRRWLQFGFSTLLKVVAAAAVLSAWWADRERLTDRIGRLENDQSVLRIAIGDEVEDGSWYSNPYGPQPGVPWVPTYPVHAASFSAATTAVISTIPVAPPEPPVAFSARGGGAALGAGTGAVIGSLYGLLKPHQHWLKAHCAEDRSWQEFLAGGEPKDASVIPAVAVVPELPSASSPPPTSPAALPLQADSAAAKQCLPAVVKLLRAGDAQARRQAAETLAFLGGLAAGAATRRDPAIRRDELAPCHRLHAAASRPAGKRRFCSRRVAARLADGSASLVPGAAFRAGCLAGSRGPSRHCRAAGR
jgi:hypothetical protein